MTEVTKPEAFAWNDDPNDVTGFYDKTEMDKYLQGLEGQLKALSIQLEHDHMCAAERIQELKVEGERQNRVNTDQHECLIKRLRDACVGFPATIPWPHRLLHEASDRIEELESYEEGCRSAERLLQEALAEKLKLRGRVDELEARLAAAGKSNLEE